MWKTCLSDFDEPIVDAIRLHPVPNEINNTSKEGHNSSDFTIPGYQSRNTSTIDLSRLGTSIRI